MKRKPLTTQMQTRFVIGLILFWACLLSFNDVEAQLRMRVISAGFGSSRCGRDRWIPISVLIENRDKDIEGEVDLYTVERHGREFRRVGLRSYVMPVNIPRNSRKIFTVYYRDPTPGFVRIDLKSKPRGGKTIVSTIPTCPFRSFRKEYPVLALGNVESIKSFLVSAKIDGMPVVTLSIPDMGMPDRSIGYDCLETIFANAYDFSKLSQTQQSALLEWVESGGHLMISFAAEIAAGASLISSALPFDRESSVKVPDLGAVAKFSSAADLSGETLIAAGAVQGDSAKVLLAHEGAPIIVEGRHGLGRITYLAFDVSQPPIRGWPGNAKLAAKLLRSRRRQPRAQQIEDFASGVLQNATALRPPSFWSIGLFLLVYILLIGPANYFALRKIGRKEWVSWTIPAVVVAFTIGCYFAGYLMKGGKVQLTKLSVVKMREGHPRAVVTTYMGFFSPARRSYEVAVDDPSVSWNVFEPTYWGRRRRETRRGVDFVQGERWTLRDLRASMWSMRAFQATHRADVGKVTSDLSIAKGTISGEITNETSYPFSSAIVLVGDSFAALGAFGTNQTLNIASRLSWNTSGVQFFNRLRSISRRHNLNVYGLRETMPSIGRRTWLHSALFIGITDADLLNVGTNGENVPSKSHALVFVELPLLRQGKSVELAAGMTPRRVSSGQLHRLGLRFSQNAEVEFELPFTVEEVEVEKMGFVAQLQRGYNTPFTMKLYDWQAKRWQEISESDFDSILSSENYIHPDTGIVKVRLTSPKGRWVYLDRFDLTFKGSYK